MASYLIEVEIGLGWSHYGPESAKGKGSVELSDEDVKTLVDLIRKTGTTDVYDMKLKSHYPKIYKKLDEAYHKLSLQAVELHWLWEGYHNHYFEYDGEELEKYCKEHLGYEPIDPNTIKIDKELEKVDKFAALFDQLERVNETYRQFSVWIEKYINSLSTEEAVHFFHEHMNAETSVDEEEYIIEIPKAICKLAEQ